MTLQELFRRMRPREGWWTFLLVLTLVVCLPAAVIAGEWVPGDELLVFPAVVAFLVGRWLATRRDWRWAVWIPIGVSAGWLTATVVASQHLIFAPGGGRAALGFTERFIEWARVVAAGGESQASDVFLFLVALAVWLDVVLVGWAYYRRESALTPFVLASVPTAVAVFYSTTGIGWLVTQIAVGVILMAVGHMAFSEGRWDAANVDYATDLGMGVAAVAVPVAAVVAAVSFLAPRLDAQEISDWFWRTFREPSRQVDDTMDRVFGGVAEPRGGPPGGSGGNGVGGGLPQTRLLGGRPDLQQDVVLVVWTDEPPPPMVPEYAMEEIYDPPRHYWRGAAFDEYTGRGWSISAMTRTHISGEIPLFTPPYYRQVQQEVRFVVPHGDTLYALGEPVWITQPVEAVWYMPPVTDAVGVPVDAMPGVPDLAGLASTRMTYTVTSRLPEPMAGELRGSIPEYPEEISQRYLQLPVTVPERVRDLAVEVTADGRTAFDKAQLLERYLRLYPYSLDVEAPPEGVVDVADYFLFDLREGYCDYYATAYVIMARSVGIPARLSSGYVGGYYSTADGAYVVRESDGHSWPEVFFPGWGWIIFEPTGSQRPARFDEDVPVVPASVPAPTGPPARVVKTRWRMAVLAVLSVLLVAVFARRLLRHRRQRVSEISLSSVWMWVGQEGTRLGVPPDPALTPAEYARRLASELGARAERTSRRRRVWMERALATEAELSRLAGQYAREMYSGHRAVRVHSRKLDETWQALRAELHRFLWLGRLLVLTRRSWTGSGAAQGGERPG